MIYDYALYGVNDLKVTGLGCLRKGQWIIYWNVLGRKEIIKWKVVHTLRFR